MDILEKCLEIFDKAVADTPAPRDGATSEEAQELYRNGFILGVKMSLAIVKKEEKEKNI